MELQRKNMPATPDDVFVSGQPMNISSGERTIPPPVPVRPERKPMPSAPL